MKQLTKVEHNLEQSRENKIENAFSQGIDSLSLFRIPVWNGTMKTAIDWIVSRARLRIDTRIGFANANNLNIAYDNRKLAKHYQECDSVFADGSGILFASLLKSNKIVENINGTDMLPRLCEALEQGEESIFLFGSEPGISEQAANNLKQTYPALRIAGTHHGFINSEIDNQKIINKINNSKASILLIAMGTPLQENWLSQFESRINVPIKLSVGGLFDFYAHKVSRAPTKMRSLGIEWIWRMIQEPNRMWRRYLVGNPLFLFRVLKEVYRQNFKHSIFSAAKRLFDLAAATTLLICLSPLFIFIAIAIKIESHGSVFFSQNRVGKNGVLFRFWKFRSMKKNAHLSQSKIQDLNESSGGILFKIRKDPRVTKVGQFIRRFSIDELPQLWNVVKGEMSLVGPRPALPQETLKYSQKDRERLSITPGLTCYWQVNGRSDLSFSEQVRLDIKYIKERSILTDLLILFKTIPAVLSGKGAY